MNEGGSAEVNGSCKTVPGNGGRVTERVSFFTMTERERERAVGFYFVRTCEGVAG